MKFKKSLFALSLGLAVPVGATASGQGDAIDAYVAAVPFYTAVDDARGTEDGLGVQFTYGRRLTGNWYLEGTLAGSNLETDVDGGTDFYQTFGGLDLAYRFGDLKGFTPFVLVGLGGVRDDVFPDSDDSTNFYANAGAGFVSGELGQLGVRLRGDARFIYDDFQGGMNDWRVGLGLEIPLGRTREVVREVRVEVPVVKEVIKEVATAPADSDGDGVVDGVDRCPNTLKGAKVGQYGCVVEKQTVRIDGVFFKFDSAELTPESLQTLQNATLSIQSQPDISLEIAGHTDSVGSEEYNRQLSQARAESVENYLVSQGVSDTRMTPMGYGESDPVTTNETENGRARNRRVEFRIQGQ